MPRSERAGEGGGPTEAAAAEDKAEAPATDETKLFMKLLHMKEDSPTKVYGWIQNSYTGNTNGRPKNDLNFGVNPNNLANTWMGNQYYIILERLARQDDSINFGFRIDTLFGNDAQFNHGRAALHLRPGTGWDRQFDNKLTWSYIGGFSANSKDGKTSLASTFIYGPDQFPTFLDPKRYPIYPTGAVPPPPQFASQLAGLQQQQLGGSSPPS